MILIIQSVVVLSSLLCNVVRNDNLSGIVRPVVIETFTEICGKNGRDATVS